MSRRELMTAVAGLIVGLVLGAVMIGTSDDLRTSLFGSAVDNNDSSLEAKGKDVVFYRVGPADASAWLTEAYPDATGEELDATLDILGKLPESSDFGDEFLSARDQVQTVLLTQVYAALIQADNPKEPKVDPTNLTSTCLGMDENPTLDAPTLYLYLTIPAEQAKNLEIPAEWEKLDVPLENTLYWQLLACYPELEKE